MITGYDILFIVRDGFVSLHLLIPQYGYLALCIVLLPVLSMLMSCVILSHQIVDVIIGGGGGGGGNVAAVALNFVLKNR